ncbi:MAG TPA: hypothetical protein VFV08_07695, partial [Puia sp.]|nr:hypothetical protein [Puia sp.]
IAITEQLKVALDSGLLKSILDLIPGHIGEEAVALLQKAIPGLLAAELALQGLPDNPTEEDVQAFAKAIADAITKYTPWQKSKLWTTLAAQIYALLKNSLADGKLTFAEAAADVEQAYQDYLQDKAAEESGGEATA